MVRQAHRIFVFLFALPQKTPPNPCNSRKYFLSLPLEYKLLAYDDPGLGSYIEYAILHVPAKALDAYKANAHWINFKSIVAVDAGEITLTNKYTVSVYATKDGYDKSDTATLDIIGSAGAFGDLNEDGEVNVADHVELSKIILNQK
jgi:hypothetical protein